MGSFIRKKFDFDIPDVIENAIRELEDDVINDRYFDISIELLRCAVHECQDMEITEEQGEEIIDYYYRRRWQ